MAYENFCHVGAVCMYHMSRKHETNQEGRHKKLRGSELTVSFTTALCGGG